MPNDTASTGIGTLTMDAHLLVEIEYDVLETQLTHIAAPANRSKVPEMLRRLQQHAPSLTRSAIFVEILYLAAALADPAVHWSGF